MSPGKTPYEYNADFMREALNLYFQGLSFTKITARMNKEYAGVCRQTIARIARECGWEKQRAGFLEIKNTDGVERRTEIVKLVREMIEKLEFTIKNKEHNHQHFAQLARFVELEGKLMGWMFGGEEAVLLSNDNEMNAYLDAIEEVLGDQFKKARKRIKDIYERNLGKNGKKNRIDRKI